MSFSPDAPAGDAMVIMPLHVMSAFLDVRASQV
jgi:hypothetical protein